MPVLTEPKTICVDFDQTICDSKYPECGKPKPGARKALLALKKMGFTIIISSCRSCGWNWDIYYAGSEFIPAKDRKVFKDMVAWLKKHKMPYDVVDDGTKGKVSASYYVDDKGVRYDNNWPEVLSTVERLEKGK